MRMEMCWWVQTGVASYCCSLRRHEKTRIAHCLINGTLLYIQRGLQVQLTGY